MKWQQAKKLRPFRREGDGYEMQGTFGWQTCTPEQNAILDRRKDEHVPLAPIMRKARQKGAGGAEAFGLFVVDGLTK